MSEATLPSPLIGRELKRGAKLSAVGKSGGTLFFHQMIMSPFLSSIFS